MPRKRKTTTPSPSKLSECNHGDYVQVDEWHRVTLNPMGLRRCKQDGTEDNTTTGWRPVSDMRVVKHRPAQASVDEGAVEDPLA